MAKYPDLKSFVQANYLDLIKSSIQKFVDKNLDSHGFHSINVYSLVPFVVENPQVMTVKCEEANLKDINMKIGVAADVVEMSLGNRKVEADRKTRWFYVVVKADIDDKLQHPELIDVKEYFNGPFDPVHALDQFLLPYVYTQSLEEMGEDFNLFYCSDAIYNMYEFPAEHVLNALQLACYEADLPDNCLGRMYFRDGKATTYFKYPYVGTVKKEGDTVKRGTILINRKRYKDGHGHNIRLTIAHELVHWYLHQKYFKLLSILNDENSVLSCEVEPSQLTDEMTPAQRAHWFAEWQANALALRIVMPQSLTVQAFHEAKAAASPYIYKGSYVEDIIERVADLFDVPIYIVKQRARQLDWDLVDGAFVKVDGKYHDSFAFEEGTLDQHQTFVIDQAGYDRLYQKNSYFRGLIDSGEYIYLGYVVCRNDPRYVEIDTTFGDVELKLTREAREHAEKCCLIFSWKSISYLDDTKDPYEFYGQAFLCKDVSAASYLEYDCDPLVNKDKSDSDEAIDEELKIFLAAVERDKKIEKEMVMNDCDDFGKTLTYHMDRKHVTVDQLAEYSHLSTKTITNYRNGEVPNPPIENVMAVCVGLKLHEDYSIHLLKMASYTLEKKKPRDRAYMFCLKQSKADIDTWNRILEKLDQPPIPYKRNQKTA